MMSIDVKKTQERFVRTVYGRLVKLRLVNGRLIKQTVRQWMVGQTPLQWRN